MEPSVATAFGAPLAGKQRQVFTPQNNQYPPNKGQAQRSLSKYQQYNIRQHQSSNLKNYNNEIDQLTAMGIQYKTQAPKPIVLETSSKGTEQECKGYDASPSKYENTKIVVNLPNSEQSPPKVVHNLGLKIIGKAALETVKDSLLNS